MLKSSYTGSSLHNPQSHRGVCTHALWLPSLTGADLLRVTGL